MARRRGPTRWTCPVCGRSVPPDVATCYCGTSRALVEARAARERQASEPAFRPLALLGGAVVLGGALYLALASGASRSGDVARSLETPPPSDVPPARPAPVATEPRVPLEAGRPFQWAPEQPSERQDAPSAPPVSPPPASPSPPAKAERSEVDVEREAGEKRLAQALTKLAGEVRRLSANTSEFESVCLSTRGDQRSCEQLFEVISSGSEALAKGLDEAEEDARRSWVAPGVVRDLRLKNGLEEARCKDVEDAVRRLAIRYRGGS